MADVFLSYAREDTARAEQIARGLQAAGLDVFWDIEVPPGASWADHIEQKLAQCKALIVLWSAHSVGSQWVREEARMGRDKNCLIPVMIDASQPPFGFGEVQAANLADWSGDEQDPNWRRFVDAVLGFCKRELRPAPPPAAVPSPQPMRQPPPQQAAAGPAPAKPAVPVWVWVAGAVVATLAVLGVIGSMLPDEQQQAPDVQAAAGQGDQQPDYRQQVYGQLAQAQQALAAQGFTALGQYEGGMPAGQSTNYQFNLEAGGDYRIVAVCDNDCGDLDLLVYDTANNLIAQNREPDATPVVSIAAHGSGPVAAQVVMHQCSVAPCFYAVAIFGRPL